MLKKLISLLLTITMLVGAAPLSALAEVEFTVEVETPSLYTVSFYVLEGDGAEKAFVPYVVEGTAFEALVVEGSPMESFPPNPPSIGDGYEFTGWSMERGEVITGHASVYANYSIPEDPNAPRIQLSQLAVSVVETRSAVVTATVHNLDVDSLDVSVDKNGVIDAEKDITQVKQDTQENTYIVTITPERGAVGNATLTFTATGAEGSASAQLPVTVTAASQPEVISPKEPIHIPYDATHTVLIAAQDDETLTYTIQTPPVNGTASMEGNMLSYTPDQNAADETVEVQVSNGINATMATVEFVAYKPLEGSQNPDDFAFEMEEDQPEGLPIPLTMVTDTLGREITFTQKTPPLHGDVVIGGNEATYIPAEHYFGEDSFALTAANRFYTADFTLDIAVEAVEDAPVAANDEAAVDSNGSVLIDALDNDRVIDVGKELVLSLDDEDLKKPGKALVCEVRDGQIYYQPDPFAQGEDTFEYAVRHEGGVLSAKALVTVAITSVNDPHKVHMHCPEGAEIAEDTLLAFTVTITDMDTLPADMASRFALSFTSTNAEMFSNDLGEAYAPSYLFESATDNSMTYTATWRPAPYANTTEKGSVSIQVVAKDLWDEAMADATAIQPVTVTPVNNAPQLRNVPAETQYVDEDHDYELVFQVYDVDIANPADFTITASSGNQDVVLDADCKVTLERQIDSRTAEYKLVVAPLANRFHEEGFPITLTAYDDGVGEDQLSDAKLFALVVRSVNDLPVAKDDFYTILEEAETVFDVLSNDTDGDGHGFLDIISVSECKNGGTAAIVYGGNKGRSISYTPVENYFGTDQFTYQVHDGEGEYSEATVVITITSVNDKPGFLNLLSNDQASPDTSTGYRTTEDISKYTFPVYVTDVETEEKALMLQARIESGKDIAESVYVQPVDIDEPQKRVIELVPKADQNGYVQLRLMLSDGETTLTEYIWVYVEPVNDKPVAVTDSFSFDENATIYIDILSLLKNDTDVDLDTGLKDDLITLVGHDMKTNNSVEMKVVEEDGRMLLEYQSVLHSEKNDFFHYTIKDSHGETAQGVVSLVCKPFNDTPVVAFAPFVMEGQVTAEADGKFVITIDEDGMARIVVNYSDYETAKEELIVTVGSTGNAIVNAAGISWNEEKTVLTITPIADSNGSATVTVTASDGYLNGSNSFVLNVTSVPDTPTAVADEYEAVAGRLTVLSPLLNDYDVDAGETISLLHFELPKGAADAGFALQANVDGRTLSFLAPAGFEGEVVIPYSIADSSGATADSTITVRITAFGTGPMILAYPAIIMTSLEGDIARINLQVVNVPGDATYQLAVTADNGGLLPDSCFSLAGGMNIRNDLIGATTQLAITPLRGTAGSANITVTLTYDGKTDSIAIPIIITRDNSAPIAVDDKLEMREDDGPQMLEVLANDSDAQVPLNITILNVERKSGAGTMTLSKDYKIVTYHPPTSYDRYYYADTAVFTYTIVDGGGKTASADIIVEIEAAPTRPLAFGEYPIYSAPDAETLADGYTVHVSSLWENDSDYDDNYNEQKQKPETMKIVAKCTEIYYEDSTTDAYAFSLASDGSVDSRVLTFTPTKTGWYRFKYAVSTLDTDGVTRESNEVTAWIGITVNNEPIPPRVSGDTFYMDEDSEGISRSVDGYIHAANKQAFPVNLSEDEGYWRYAEGTPQTLLDSVSLEMVDDADGKGNRLFWLKAVPAPDMNGSVKIQWMVNQAVGGVTAHSAVATFTLHIYPVNDAPQIDILAEEAGLAMQGDTPITLRGDQVVIPVTIRDIDNTHAQLRATLLSDDDKFIPSDEILLEYVSGDTYHLIFTPVNAPTENPQNNPITIKVSIFDGEALVSDEVSVIIMPKNNPPEARAMHEAQMLEDAQGEFDVVIWGRDPDGDPLTILCNPATETIDQVTGEAFVTGVYFNGKGEPTSDYGYAQIDNKKIIFSPAKDYYTTGDDFIEIRYALTDGELTSNLGIIRLTIEPQNDKPEIYGIKQQETMHEDVPAEFVFYAYDIDGDDLTFYVSHNDDDAQFMGSVAVLSAVKDEATGEWTITVRVTLQPDAYTRDTDSPVIVSLSVSDAEETVYQNIELTILPVNDGVRLREDVSLPYRIEILEDETEKVDITSLFYDPEDDEISIVELGTATHGSVVNQNNMAVFTPTKDYFTPVENPQEFDCAVFTFTVSDPYSGASGAVTGQVIITIIPVNDPPVARSFMVGAVEDDPEVKIEVFLPDGSRAYDVDNTMEELRLVSIDEVTSARKGTVEISEEDGRTIYYYPNPDANGKDTFGYTISDLGEDGVVSSDDTTAKGVVTVNIESVIDDPRISFETSKTDKDSWYSFPAEHDDTVWTMKEDIPAQFAVHVWTPEENFNLSLRIAVQNADGGEHKAIIPREKVILVGANEDYTVSLSPLLNMFGELWLEFTLSDGNTSVMRKVKVVVEPVNDLPVIAVDGAFEVDEDAATGGTIRAADVETGAEALDVYLAEDNEAMPGAKYGDAMASGNGANGEWSYTPYTDYYGEDSFWIGVRDEEGESAYEKITITVRPINDAPTTPQNARVDKQSKAYRDGETITLSYEAGGDDNAYHNETRTEDLTYEIEVTYDGKTWVSPEAERVVVSGLSYEFTPNYASDASAFGVRVRTWDTGVAGAEPTASPWVEITSIHLDSAAPVLSYRLDPDSATSGNVIIYVTVEEGGSGIAQVEFDETTGNRATLVGVDGNAYKYEVEVNRANYTFRATDAAGNVSDDCVTPVNLIDKLPPVATCDTLPFDESAGKYADSGVKIALTFEDVADITEDQNIHTGIATQQYILTESNDWPAESEWDDYLDGSPVELDAKGEWYIHVRATDGVGNRSAQTTFGPYVINNSTPYLPEEEDEKVLQAYVYEEEVEGIGMASVAIDLNQHVKDMDLLFGGNEKLTFTIAPMEWDGVLGTLVEDRSGIYTFIHSGEGRQPFAPTLTFAYTATDTSGAFVDGVVNINVTEVNDRPNTPASVSVTPTIGRADTDVLRNGDTVEITWVNTPAQGRVDEETDNDQLIYRVYVSYDGGENWTRIATDLPFDGSCGYVIDYPGGNTSQLQFYVEALDLGAGNGATEYLAPKTSLIPEARQSYSVDNLAPLMAEPVQSSQVWTKNNMIVTLTVTDGRGGDSGVAAVRVVGGDRDGETLAAVEGRPNEYQFIATQNGTYAFAATDKVGNENADGEVSVTLIDKEPPFATADEFVDILGGADEIYVGDEKTIQIKWEDVPETLANGMSDVKTSEYVLTSSDKTPTGGWLAYPETGVPLDTKGTWYLYTRTIDNAGNEKVESQDTYVVANSSPVIAVPGAEVIVYEEYLDTSRARAVTIDLNKYVNDPDMKVGTLPSSNEKLTFTLVNGGETANSYGQFSGMVDGVCTFTHSGAGNPFEPSFSFHYTATDEDGAEATGTVTIKVVEVNDPPSAPALVKLETEKHLMDGDRVAVVWTDGALANGRVDEETEDEAIEYNVYVKYHTKDAWTLLTKNPISAHRYEHEIDLGAGNNTAELQYAVEAVDTGALKKTATGDDEDKGQFQGPKTSELKASNPYKVDNTAPAISGQQSPASWSKGPVDIILTVTDDRIGDSGVAQVKVVGGEEEGNALASSQEKPNEYVFTVVVNGVYSFTAVDNVGNEIGEIFPVTVTTIDQLAPFAEAGLESITEDDMVQINQVEATIAYFDEEANGIYGKSGVKTEKYILSEDSKTPADDAQEWEAYQGAIPLDTKGIWYLYARTEDNAGNVTVQPLATYVIANSAPLVKQALLVFDIWEDTSTGKSNAFTIDLITDGYVWDVDGDALTVTLDEVKWDQEVLGELEEEGNGRYRFTHSGYGVGDFIDQLQFTFTVEDVDGDTKQGDVVINVHEINDIPHKPVRVALTETGPFQGGAEVIITWENQLIDGRVDEETELKDLIYNVYCKYRDGDWALIGTVPGTGDTRLPYQLSSEEAEKANTSELYFAVSITDGGVVAKEGALGAQTSAETESPAYTVDTTAPTISRVLAPTAHTNGDVTITMVVEDKGEGATGIDSFTATNAGAEGDLVFASKTVESATKHTYVYTATANGDYTFTAMDKVGNPYTASVSVTNIDKLMPAVVVEPALLSHEQGIYANSDANITITYSDPEGDEDNMQTGIASFKYALALEGAGAPAAEDWKSAAPEDSFGENTVVIPLSTKGEWRLYVRAVDGAGNETTGDYGTYFVRNRVPVISTPNLELTVYEDSTEGITAVDIDLTKLLSDADGDSLVYTRTNVDWVESKLGALERKENGKYRFEHSGDGTADFDYELVFTYTVSDGDSGFDGADDGTAIEGTVTITVKECNDKPSAPESVWVTRTAQESEPMTRDDPYQGGTPVTIYWSYPENGRMDEETGNEAMVYEVFVKYTGSEWTSLGKTEAGKTSMDCTLAMANTAELVFAVEAIDAGVAANGETGAVALEAKRSDRKVSDAAYQVDSAAPIIAYAFDPSVETSGKVKIILTVKDLGAGAAGVKSLDVIYGENDPRLEQVEESNENDGVHTYVYIASVNGTYTFTATDHVGNTSEVYPVVVNLIDTLPPKISADVETIGLDKAVYARQQTITLTYEDAEATKENLRTGIASYAYALTKSQETPTAWVTAENGTDAAAPQAKVPLKTEGAWYLHVRAVDRVGNVTIAFFGSYVVLNNAPVIAEMPASAQVYEEEETPGSNKATIDLNDYVTDADGDSLTFTILSRDWDSSVLGDLEEVSEGKYSFTHNGNGNPFVGALTFTYRVDDEAGGSAIGAAVFNVVEFNDAPSRPVRVWIQGGDSVKDGEAMVEWQATSTPEGRVDEETDNSAILYEVFIQYGADTEWVSLGISEPGASTMAITLEGNRNLTGLRVGVTATDQALPIGLPAKTSPMRESEAYTLDNITPLVLGYTLEPNAPTKEDVVIRLTVSDPGDLATGVVAVNLVAGNATFLRADGNDYYYEVTTNGTHTFIAVDAAGNQSNLCPVKVALIDKLAPAITPDPKEITVNDQILFGQQSITLTYADAAATDEYLSAGIAKQQYALTLSAEEEPIAWSDYAGAIPLDTKGVWYLHARATDAVGNTLGYDQQVVFGPYVILDSPPAITQKDPRVTVYEEAEAGSASVSFDLNDCFELVDPSNALTFTITEQPANIYGTLEKIGEGQYTFTHSGYGRQPFSRELVVKYAAAKGDSARATGQVTIDVAQYNDAPNAPQSIALTKSGPFRDGDEVTIQWADTLTDGRVDEETDNADIAYEIYVRDDSAGAWNLLARTAAGASSYAYRIEGGINTSSLQFAALAVDSALEQGALAARKSPLVFSGRYTVDNLPPRIHVAAMTSAGAAYEVDTPNRQPLTLAIDYFDDGASGLAETKYLLTTATQPQDRTEYLSAGAETGNRIEITAAGEYDLYLYARDNAGNETTMKVGQYLIQKTEADGQTSDSGQMPGWSGVPLEALGVDTGGDFYPILGKPMEEDRGVLSARFLNTTPEDSDKHTGSTVLVSPDGKVMLIDAGDESSGELIARMLEEMGIKYIDYIVGTHPDENFIGGLIEVLNYFRVGTVYTSELDFEGASTQAFLKALQENKVRHQIVYEGDIIRFGDEITMEVMHPKRDKLEEDLEAQVEPAQMVKDLSLIMKLQYQESSMIFVPDGLQDEDELVEKFKDQLQADIIKIPHHGADTSYNQTWHEAVSPKFGVALRDKEADMEALRSYWKNGTEILMTSMDGCVKLTTAGDGNYAIRSQYEREQEFLDFLRGLGD